jgi:hypothetical protein
MNTYNENLHATVVASLQSQYLDQKNLQSQVNASMFTLYHAEGATITANEKLETAKADTSFKELVKKQAVINNNISNNLLASATQTNQYLKQSITNTAVCASNVQIAATSIVRLASDIGSMFSIVHAADFLTDTYKQTENVRDLMNQTAYAAEMASQFAMEATMLASEVSVPTVLDKAKSTTALMNNLLGVASSEFTTASQIVAADNATLATASAAEKLAEGALEDISVDYKAAKAAYNSINRELNLNLVVPKKNRTDTSFLVRFNLLKSAFPNDRSLNDVNRDKSKHAYPIKDYYAILVKDNKKSTFSLSNAESLLQQGKTKSITHIASPFIASTMVKNWISKEFHFLNMPLPDKTTYVLQDSDGQDVQYGQNYVVFIMAVYMDEYKREINDFDDFLSAPSKNFKLTINLSAINSKTIEVNLVTPDKDAAEIQREELFQNAQVLVTPGEIGYIEDLGQADIQTLDYIHKLEFNADADFANKPQYRCILLPASTDLTGGLLSKSSLEALLETEVTDLEAISDTFDPEIALYESELMEINTQHELAGTTLKTITENLNKYDKEHPKDSDIERVEPTELLSQQSFFASKVSELELNARTIQQLLTDALAAKQAMLDKLNTQDKGTPGIFFNLILAEKVSAGNYAIAVWPKLIADDAEVKSNAKKTETPAIVMPHRYFVYIGPETTDAFGNPLIAKKKYIPVILTVSLTEIDDPDNYTNALSAIDPDAAFSYTEPKPIITPKK